MRLAVNKDIQSSYRGLMKVDAARFAYSFAPEFASFP